MLTVLCLVCLILAGIPALLFLDNLRHYQAPQLPREGRELPGVSVLIPARNEESSIGRSVSAAVANVGIDLEVIVLDDHSDDDTAAIVKRVAATDSRVRLQSAPELPEDWCGKQHACAVLAREATKPLLVFIDADVQLMPDSLARMAAFLEDSGADLASGFPRQETVGLSEKLVIPLIHFILLGFLPIRRMRVDRSPGLGAGCGQLFITKRASYEQLGGHAVIRTTLHDGLKLPRAYRAAGLKTELFDATDLAACRMYCTASELWFGLAKNAGEALASSSMIGPATFLLFGGQVVPFLLVTMGHSLELSTTAWLMAWGAVGGAYLPRIFGAVRFRQSWLGALLHPAGVLMLLAIQWYAFTRDALGRPAIWKGRPYHARMG